MFYALRDEETLFDFCHCKKVCLIVLTTSVFVPWIIGTTKRKELHGSISTRGLSGTWGNKPDAIFRAYKMDFTCSIAEQKYSSFVLLLESKLADDVGKIDVDLYLLSKFVKASVSPYGKMHLDAQQVKSNHLLVGVINSLVFLHAFIFSY